MPDLRSLPSVDGLLQTTSMIEWVNLYGRPLVVKAIRTTLETTRDQFPETGKVPESAELLQTIETSLREWTTPSLLAVINATGVIIHTNLGRAPLSESAIYAIHAAAQGYTNLEFDLETGQRGSRLIHAESLLQQLTGAEAALVVNNNAASVLLGLIALAHRRRVIIARSQLVEIGGGFRIPDVMKQSGAKLVEIGATNRVHVSDYEDALREPTALVMRAHRSNFKITGFTQEPSLAEIVRSAHAAGVPVMDDLGSGTLLDTSIYGMEYEPCVQDSLDAAADLICFSGDKLLGGPQVGIIIGRAELITKLKKHPLARAVRADKLCLAGLSATLLHYLKGEAEQKIPVWRMIALKPAEIKTRAEQWVQILGCGTVIPGTSTVGGGSLPGETLPTFLFALEAKQSKRFMERLRTNQPPVIARIEEKCVVLDPRTVLPEQETDLLRAIGNALI